MFSKRIIPQWCAYFDRIYLINLKSRKDRLYESIQELKKYNIPFIRWEAMEYENGAMGLYDTMTSLFVNAIDNGYRKILVFEDDVKFLQDPTLIMDRIILEQLPTNWELLYLGCNHSVPFINKRSSNLLICERALATHSVAYSLSAMNKILQMPRQLPFDVLLADKIQPKSNGFSYCVTPMLATQKDGYSSIEKRLTSYSMFLEDRFIQHSKHLK